MVPLKAQSMLSVAVGHPPLPLCPPCQQKQDEINANRIDYGEVIPAHSPELKFEKTDNSWGDKLNMKQNIDCTSS